MRVLLDADPFPDPPETPWYARGRWPARWLTLPADLSPPAVVAYRLRLSLEQAVTARLHISADERYELFLDGERVGRGPERGEPGRWPFESYDLNLAAGGHMLVARVTALGDCAPVAQHSARHGLLLCPQDPELQPLLATGLAPWEALSLAGYRFLQPPGFFLNGHTAALDGASFPWGFEHGGGEGWSPAPLGHLGYSALTRVEALPHEHQLTPAALPPMLDRPWPRMLLRHLDAPPTGETHALPALAEHHLAAEAPAWEALLGREVPLAIPAHTRRRAIIDLDDYVCAYPELMVSGGAGAAVRLHWQESLFAGKDPWDKGNRDEVAGKFFTTIWSDQDGYGDRWVTDGGPRGRLDTFWWRAGRYIELLVETAAEPLTIEALTLHETRYPLDPEGGFACADDGLNAALPLMVRALQMCAHETYQDTPFYEQLQYVGDTRLECLLTYALTRDDRLPRRALTLFDRSRLPGGLTTSRYPSRLRQLIPPFALWWTAMAHDYLHWRDDAGFVRGLLPGIRSVLEAFTALRGDDGLPRSPEGWNFVDWLEAWPEGEPPGARPGDVCAPLCWQYVYALTHAAEVEQAVGAPELADRWARLAHGTAAALDAAFWDEGRGLYADDIAHTRFSEHSQCLALLSRALPQGRRGRLASALFGAEGLLRPSVYFTHYLFEVCRELERVDVLFERLAPWLALPGLGFRTTYEQYDPRTTRSDCHAWGAHPLYHLLTAVLGVQPATPGFGEVLVAPQLGPLRWARGSVAHPWGLISVEVRWEGERLAGRVVLPKGVRGTLRTDAEQRTFLGTTEF